MLNLISSPSEFLTSSPARQGAIPEGMPFAGGPLWVSSMDSQGGSLSPKLVRGRSVGSVSSRATLGRSPFPTPRATSGL